MQAKLKGIDRHSEIIYYLFLTWFFLEGAVRKWLFPSLNQVLFLGKYVLLIGAMSVFLVKKNRWPREFFLSFIYVYILYGIMEFFNLRATEEMIVPIFGLIIHFLFIGVIFINNALFNTEEKLTFILNIILFSSIPVFIIGIVQYFSPVDSFLNKYASESTDLGIAVVGDRVRISGIFAYLATHASYSQFIGILCLSFLINSLIKGSINPFYSLVLGLSIINLFMTGSRGSTLTFFAMAGIFLLWLFMTGEKKIYKIFPLLIILLVMSGVIVLATEAGRTAIENWLERFNSNSDLTGRLEDTFSPFKFADKSGFFGFGIGTTYQGTYQYLTYRNEMPMYWEEESERIVIELGVIGFFIVMAVRISIFAFSLTCFLRMKNKNLRNIAGVLTVMQIPYLLLISTTIFTYMDSLIYWFSAGTIVACKSIDLVQRKSVEIKELTSS